ncbi:GAF and ANTAR domain-containing protein [Kribbella qitaiheensis]|uniref:GAF and ANTAR domain-containing protein n=1 Tax=Kribbella qitaiheensis TaxID=1544730 RepID=A0A7G6WS96_9ACTN|nr:GAF and ANTAR domain-containing protein [Kribbella qitaiheensis]QNE16861.1 GAF and ANTAR domain-containing protein [Kribbella qitaiheensis]
MEPEAVVETARRLAEALKPGDLDQTLSRITAAAVEVLPEVDFCSITILHADGSLDTSSPTDEKLWKLDQAQYQFREGPCYEAATTTVHVISPDLANDERFPQYAAVAVRDGIRAHAGLRLFDGPKGRAALNLYSETLGAFSDLASLGALFAHQSAVAIGYAYEIRELQEAVKTRGLIGQAVGIVMERYKLNDQRAFAFLARLSQHGNIKLRRVAEQLVATVPQPTDDR